MSWTGSVYGARTWAGSVYGALGWAGNVTWAGSVYGALTRAGSVYGALAWAGSVYGALIISNHLYIISKLCILTRDSNGLLASKALNCSYVRGMITVTCTQLQLCARDCKCVLLTLVSCNCVLWTLVSCNCVLLTIVSRNYVLLTIVSCNYVLLTLSGRHTGAVCVCRVTRAWSSRSVARYGFRLAAASEAACPSPLGSDRDIQRPLTHSEPHVLLFYEGSLSSMWHWDHCAHSVGTEINEHIVLILSNRD